MRLEVGKSYITECGYIATLGKDFRDVNLTPGLNNAGESTANNEKGWIWVSDGQIFGLMPEWCKKLKIIAEFKLMTPLLPEGYEWKHGYPCLESPKGGDFYISTITGHPVKASDNYSGDLESRRFTLKKSLSLSPSGSAFIFGNSVTCIDPNAWLTKNKAYLVIECHPETRQIKIKTDSGLYHWYNTDRFVLAKAKLKGEEELVKVMQNGFNITGEEQVKKKQQLAWQNLLQDGVFEPLTTGSSSQQLTLGSRL